MNNHEHMKNLINLGFLVDEKAREKIESLNEEQFFKLMESLKKDNAFIVNEATLKTFLTEDVKIINTIKRMDAFSIQDFVKNLNERYSFLQGILIKKLEMSSVVSINKCSDGDATIIGMVKEKEEKGSNFLISLEDPTGEMQVVVEKKLGEKLGLDDVVAISGKISNRVMTASRILFPDISLKPVALSNDSIKVAFLQDKEAKADYVVYKNKIKDSIKSKDYEISNPCIFKIGNVVFLLILGYDPLDALKKRYVNLKSTDFLIEPSPDIVFTDREVNANYKGISIVTKDRIIDLKTREVAII